MKSKRVLLTLLAAMTVLVTVPAVQGKITGWTETELAALFDALDSNADGVLAGNAWYDNAVALVKNNLTATVAPDADDDVDEDYAVGSVWIDTTADNAYICLDASDGAAVWDLTNSTGSADFMAHNITDPTDDTWQGDTAPAVAGEAMTTANRWAALCCKDTGSGTRWYLYNPDAANTDNNTYLPLALLVTNDTITAGDAITITRGDGTLANSTWDAAQAQVGKAIYFSDGGAGYLSYAAPDDEDDVIKQAGTLLNIDANGRDVWDIAFSYPAVVVVP